MKPMRLGERSRSAMPGQSFEMSRAGPFPRRNTIPGIDTGGEMVERVPGVLKKECEGQPRTEGVEHEGKSQARKVRVFNDGDLPVTTSARNVISVTKARNDTSLPASLNFSISASTFSSSGARRENDSGIM